MRPHRRQWLRPAIADKFRRPRRRRWLMFKPSRIRLTIISLTTIQIMAGIRRCHFPLAGAEDIMEVAGAVAGMVAGMALVMAAGVAEIVFQLAFLQRPKVRAKSGLGSSTSLMTPVPWIAGDTHCHVSNRLFC